MLLMKRIKIEWLKNLDTVNWNQSRLVGKEYYSIDLITIDLHNVVKLNNFVDKTLGKRYICI